ncbi:MAG TPA: sulfotransferase domain-containing protein [Acidimicrobiales bacterium]|nr:sulfotransferase domain-containing protein [Acidimicrobiales bacterium]
MAAAPEQGSPPPGPPPWINDTIQQRIEWHDGDIVVSVPPKSGTTWTMNIVHQLRSGGDSAFADVYAEVPWLEFVPGPSRILDDLVAAFDAMPRDRRRAFKSHAAPPTLPYQRSGSGVDVRYVVIARNPDEALASFRPFIAAHSDAWFDLWELPREGLVGQDVETFFAGVGSQGIVPMIFGFLAAWWPLRHEPNVMLLHYADMKRDHEGSVRRIAEFLGFDVLDEQWPAILEYTSFSWMKAHEDKFELRTVGEIPILDPGAMIRKGQVGASADDGITSQISEATAAIGRTILTDPQAFDWCYYGGPEATTAR